MQPETLEEAVKAKGGSPFDGLPHTDDTGKVWRFHVERGSRWDDATNTSKPNDYFTVWVMSGWPGYPAARNLDWPAIIAGFLGVPRDIVWVGFRKNNFDVRPY